MDKEFVPYEESVDLKGLGFDKPCLGLYHNDGMFALNKAISHGEYHGQKCMAPLFQQAFKWFRDNHDLHVQIRREDYFYKRRYKYYHFDINDGEKTDITNQQDLYSSIMEECRQDIPGNHLNDEKLSQLIFERNFAFKSYEEVELFCLRKLIEIVKNKKGNNE